MVNDEQPAGGRAIFFLFARAGFPMIGAVVFTYGMLMSFVLSGASRNRKLARPNPPMLTYVGYVLVGLTGAAAILALGYAGWQSLAVTAA